MTAKRSGTGHRKNRRSRRGFLRTLGSCGAVASFGPLAALQP
ncbi:MAG: twin-arginine translocation signal domain-containing protein [Chloroflexi bacterium]|nr:twin-arginine translocation signal domain-containing protein [Chloroflexota bacterium]